MWYKMISKLCEISQVGNLSEIANFEKSIFISQFDLEIWAKIEKLRNLSFFPKTFSSLSEMPLLNVDVSFYLVLRV